ncbi:F-box protein, partial [Cucurbita argyrosperma subsp. argyrosperma]
MHSSKAPKITTPFSSAAAKSLADDDDLLLEILLRLPIRSLIRFKSVSKRWHSLISDPTFCHRRMTFQPSTPSGILCRPHSRRFSPGFDFVYLHPNPPRVPLESLEPSVPKRRFVILKSCNGLLLGRSYRKNDYYVYNPTTKQYKKLPKLQMNKNSTSIYLNLAYDPLRSSNYKVVCVRVLDSTNFEIKIYSSDSGFWRPCCEGSSKALFILGFSCGVYWNGALYWLRYLENCICLDLCEEKLHRLAIPRASDGWRDRTIKYFGNWCGRLYWIEGVDSESTELIVYEMGDDRGCGWSLKYRVDLQRVCNLFPDPSSGVRAALNSKFSVLTIVDQSEVGEEEEEEPYIVLLSGGNAIRVNVMSGRFERMQYLNNGRTANTPHGVGLIDAHFYIQSLACV